VRWRWTEQARRVGQAEQGKSTAESIETKDTIEAMETAPSEAPHQNERSSARTSGIASRDERSSKHREGRRMSPNNGPDPNHSAQEKATSAPNVQIEVTTGLMKSLLKVMEYRTLRDHIRRSNTPRLVIRSMIRLATEKTRAFLKISKPNLLVSFILASTLSSFATKSLGQSLVNED
jgi:hypothetical protein